MVLPISRYSMHTYGTGMLSWNVVLACQIFCINFSAIMGKIIPWKELYVECNYTQFLISIVIISAASLFQNLQESIRNSNCHPYICVYVEKPCTMESISERFDVRIHIRIIKNPASSVNKLWDQNVKFSLLCLCPMDWYKNKISYWILLLFKCRTRIYTELSYHFTCICSSP